MVFIINIFINYCTNCTLTKCFVNKIMTIKIFALNRNENIIIRNFSTISFDIFKVLLLIRVPGLFNQKKLIRDQTRNSDKALLGLLLQHKEVKTSNRFSCSLPEGLLAGP